MSTRRELTLRRRQTAVFLATLLIAASSALAQNAVQLKKYTNGQDADLPPGAILMVGDPVNWTYVVTNTGNRDLQNIVVTDDQGVNVTCPATTLAVGLSMTCTASGIVAYDQYTNTGTVTATVVGSGTPVTASDLSHYFGVDSVAVTIQKTTNGIHSNVAPGPSLPAGAPVNWSYLVTNTTDPLDNYTLENVVVTDDQGVTVTCPSNTVAVGGSMTCTASGTVQVGQYSNVGSVTATFSDDNIPAAASDTNYYYGQVVQIKKATNGVDADLPPGVPLSVGTPITWTYVVTNPGPAALSSVGVTDDQGVVVNCPNAGLLAGESMTCTATGVAQPGQYANIGTVTGQLPLGGVVTATDPSHYFGLPLQLKKKTNGVDAPNIPGPALAIGSAVNWTYEVSNAGATTLTGVAVTDDQGVTVNCPTSTLASGASMTCTASGTVQAGQYQNVGIAQATDPVIGLVQVNYPSHYFGQNTLVDFGDAPAPFPTLFGVNGASHLLGTGVFLGACVDADVDGIPSAGANGDDLNVGSAVFGTCAVPGHDEDGVTFPSSIIANTTGHVNVTANAACTLSAWIDFNGNGSWADSGESLFPGGTVLAAGLNSLTFAVPAGAVNGPTYTRFRCTTDGPVTFVGQASDGEVEDYQVSIGPADLSITKSGVPNPVLNGSNETYTLQFANNGPGAAISATVTDPTPANTTFVSATVTSGTGWSITSPVVGGTGSVVFSKAAVSSGETATFQVVVNVNAGTPNGTTISNTATAAAASTDPVSGNNSSTSGGTVDAKANLVVVKTDSPDPVLAGNNLTYSIDVQNIGSAVAANVQLTDVLPVNTTFVSFAAPAGWTSTTPAVGSAGTVSAANAALAGSPSAAQHFTLVVRTNPNTPDGAVISNTAAAVTTSVEADPSNNSSTSTTTVNAQADVAEQVTLDLPPATTAEAGAVASPMSRALSATVGSSVTFHITITNNGPSTALGVTFTDTLPAGLGFQSITSSGSCTTPAVDSAGLVTCTLGSMAAGASSTIDLVTKVKAAGTIVTALAVSSTTADPNLGNNVVTVTLITGLPVPLLDARGLLLLMLLMAGGAVYLLRER